MVAGAPVVPLEHPTPARAPQLVALLMGRLLMDAPHQQQLLLRQRLRLLRQQLRQLFDLLPLIAHRPPTRMRTQTLHSVSGSAVVC
jgi:hypothetical protein